MGNSQVENALFLRLLPYDDKAVALVEVIVDVASVLPQAVIFAIGSILLTILDYDQRKQQVVLMQLTKGA